MFLYIFCWKVISLQTTSCVLLNLTLKHTRFSRKNCEDANQDMVPDQTKIQVPYNIHCADSKFVALKCIRTAFRYRFLHRVERVERIRFWMLTYIFLGNFQVLVRLFSVFFTFYENFSHIFSSFWSLGRLENFVFKFKLLLRDACPGSS